MFLKTRTKKFYYERMIYKINRILNQVITGKFFTFLVV